MQSHFVPARRTKLRNQAKVACNTSVVPYGTQKVAQVANDREAPRKKWSEGFMRRLWGMSREASVDAAITRCITEGFLVDFLQNRKEVSKMILGNNITMEEYGEVQKENGRREGLKEGILQVAGNMKAEGMTADEIMRLTGLTKKQIEAL